MENPTSPSETKKIDPSGETSLENFPSFDPKPLKEQAIDMLKTIYDPEIPVNIYELGLVYEVKIGNLEDPDKGNLPTEEPKKEAVTIEMTLTSPHCPVAESLPIEVEEKIKSLQGVSSCKVNIIWEPPWSKEMMSEAALLELGMF